MVGHSQGGMMPRYYIKFLGGAEIVEDLVGLAPSNHGTSSTGGGAAEPAPRHVLPGLPAAVRGIGVPDRSTPATRLPATASYTNITTKYDEVVVPHTSGYLEPGPQTTNLTLQDVCPTDLAEHIQIPMSSDRDRSHAQRVDTAGSGRPGRCDRAVDRARPPVTGSVSTAEKK